jgi:hypothetical protein
LEVPSVLAEERQLTGLRRLPAAYVCGYLARRLMKGEPCKDCQFAMVTDEFSEDHLFISLKEYSLTTNSLKYPTQALINVVEALIDVFNAEISNIIFLKNVSEKLIAHINASPNVDFEWLEDGCPAHSELLKDRLLKLFCRMMVNHYCKRRNRNMYGKSEQVQASKKRMKVIKHT